MNAVMKPRFIDTFDLEQTIIGACLSDPDSKMIALGLLKPESFQNEFLSELFKKLSQPNLDVFLLAETIRPDDPEAKMYVLDLLRAAIQAPDWAFSINEYCNALLSKVHVNTLSQACLSVCESISDITRFNNIVEPLKEAIIKTEGEANKTIEKTYSEIVSDSLNSFYEQVERSGIIGLRTGFNNIDFALSGLQKGKLYILAARPAMGKSALAGQIALNISRREEKPVVFFSLEMAPKDIVSRLFSNITGVSLNTKEAKDLDKLTNATQLVESLNLILPDIASVSIANIASVITRDTMKFGGVSLIIVDYLQLMEPMEIKKGATRQEHVAEFSRGLKQIAREFNCPVIALSQLSRAVEGRQEKRPNLSDLRESGAIEQDADVVMFLYRDEYYNKETSKAGIAELIIGKNRSGGLSELELVFSRYNTSFSEMPFMYKSQW